MLKNLLLLISISALSNYMLYDGYIRFNEIFKLMSIGLTFTIYEVNNTNCYKNNIIDKFIDVKDISKVINYQDFCDTSQSHGPLYNYSNLNISYYYTLDGFTNWCNNNFNINISFIQYMIYLDIALTSCNCLVFIVYCIMIYLDKINSIKFIDLISYLVVIFIIIPYILLIIELLIVFSMIVNGNFFTEERWLLYVSLLKLLCIYYLGYFIYKIKKIDNNNYNQV